MLTILAALPAETRPLVRHFGLTRCDAPFPLYQDDKMTVITSGVGRLAAATAVAWWQGRSEDDPATAWLNIGIAGHRSRAVGSGHWVSRITDAASGRCLFPPQVSALPLSRLALTTVDAPQRSYPESDLVDMEASGYYHAATRFCTGELVQCFKVVSDNETQPAQGISAGKVEELVADRLADIHLLANALRELAQQFGRTTAAPAEMIRFTSRWHFTVSQQHELGRLLRRWQALTPTENVWSGQIAALQRPADVLKLLREKVGRRPVRFGAGPA